MSTPQITDLRIINSIDKQGQIEEKIIKFERILEQQNFVPHVKKEIRFVITHLKDAIFAKKINWSEVSAYMLNQASWIITHGSIKHVYIDLNKAGRVPAFIPQNEYMSLTKEESNQIQAFIGLTLIDLFKEDPDLNSILEQLYKEDTTLRILVLGKSLDMRSDQIFDAIDKYYWEVINSKGLSDRPEIVDKIIFSLPPTLSILFKDILIEALQRIDKPYIEFIESNIRQTRGSGSPVIEIILRYLAFLDLEKDMFDKVTMPLFNPSLNLNKEDLVFLLIRHYSPMRSIARLEHELEIYFNNSQDKNWKDEYKKMITKLSEPNYTVYPNGTTDPIYENLPFKEFLFRQDTVEHITDFMSQFIVELINCENKKVSEQTKLIAKDLITVFVTRDGRSVYKDGWGNSIYHLEFWATVWIEEYIGIFNIQGRKAVDQVMNTLEKKLREVDTINKDYLTHIFMKYKTKINPQDPITLAEWSTVHGTVRPDEPKELVKAESDVRNDGSSSTDTRLFTEIPPGSSLKLDYPFVQIEINGRNIGKRNTYWVNANTMYYINSENKLFVATFTDKAEALRVESLLREKAYSYSQIDVSGLDTLEGKLRP